MVNFEWIIHRTAFHSWMEIITKWFTALTRKSMKFWLCWEIHSPHLIFSIGKESLRKWNFDFIEHYVCCWFIYLNLTDAKCDVSATQIELSKRLTVRAQMTFTHSDDICSFHFDKIVFCSHKYSTQLILVFKRFYATKCRLWRTKRWSRRKQPTMMMKIATRKHYLAR